MDAETLPLRSTLHPPVLLSAVSRGLEAFAAGWRARRRQALDRRQLAEMSDHALNDLAIGRDQIQRLTFLRSAWTFSSANTSGSSPGRSSWT